MWLGQLISIQSSESMLAQSYVLYSSLMFAIKTKSHRLKLRNYASQ
jgi:hypothetical protein